MTKKFEGALSKKPRKVRKHPRNNLGRFISRKADLELDIAEQSVGGKELCSEDYCELLLE